MNNPLNLTTEKVYTVLELNESVKGLIRNQFPGYIWLCGEIQDLREREHINLNLVQKHPEQNQIIAQVRAVIFANVKPRIIKRLKEVDAGFVLKKDIEVKLLGKVDLYAKSGQFSLTVFDIDPVYTLGKIAQTRRQIIEDLRRRGVLERNKSKAVSLLPLKVGLITAYASAAYQDFINELKLSGYSFKVEVYDCYMQGQYVERDVVSALNYFDRLPSADLDVVVITRGGGSTADLSCFDNKRIAEAIAGLNFPVITGLGHEINISIADMAAHDFFKTPTAAAKFLVDKVRDFSESLDYLGGQIFSCVQNFLAADRTGLEKTAVKIESVLTRYFSGHKEELLSKKHTLSYSVNLGLLEEKRQLQRYFEAAGAVGDKVIQDGRRDIRYIAQKLELLKPQNILKRGYSLTRKEGRSLKSVDDVEAGDLIETVLYQGSLLSKVGEKSRT